MIWFERPGSRDASRWQHEGDNEPTGEKMNASGGYVEVESGIPYETVRELRKKGHDVRFDVGGYGGIKRSKSKCMMAGVFTSVPANHAKTEWRPVIDSTVGLCVRRQPFNS